MALRSEEARVLASLIEKEQAVPDSYPLTLNALRLACNQSANRHPVVAYDDRTVENALMSLKSMGLVRFVHPAQGSRTTRYRHAADERWKLSGSELRVLAVLVLRGPQTAGEVKARAERYLDEDAGTVDEILDTLAARGPDPLAVRLERRPGEREPRYAHFLLGEVEDVPPRPTDAPTRFDAGTPRGTATDDGTLAAEVAALRARLDRLERLLGLEDEPAESGSGSDRP